MPPRASESRAPGRRAGRHCAPPRRKRRYAKLSNAVATSSAIAIAANHTTPLRARGAPLAGPVAGSTKQRPDEPHAKWERRPNADGKMGCWGAAPPATSTGRMDRPARSSLRSFRRRSLDRTARRGCACRSARLPLRPGSQARGSGHTAPRQPVRPRETGLSTTERLACRNRPAESGPRRRSPPSADRDRVNAGGAAARCTPTTRGGRRRTGESFPLSTCRVPSMTATRATAATPNPIAMLRASRGRTSPCWRTPLPPDQFVRVRLAPSDPRSK